MNIIFASAKFSNISAELAKSRLCISKDQEVRSLQLLFWSEFCLYSLRIRCSSVFSFRKTKTFRELLVLFLLFWVRKAYEHRILEEF